MNITVVGGFDTENFGLHIAENLSHMGHTVHRVASTKKHDTFNRYGKLNSVLRVLDQQMHYASVMTRHFVEKPVLKEICSYSAELVITTFDYFLKEELEVIRENLPGVKIVMWFPDHLKSFDRAFFMTADYDALFFKDPFIVKNLYDIYEMNVFYLPEAFSKLRHTVTNDFMERRGEYDCDIAMIGSQHSFRVPLLEKLLDYDIKLYGVGNPWWLNTDKIKKFYTGRFAADHEKANAFCGARIALNTLYFAEIEGVNVRAFEIAGSGGFQLMQWKPGLSDLFVLDKEVVAYHTAQELREKIDYYLEHTEERQKIAAAGKRRAWAEHSYEPRLQRLIDMTFSTKDIARNERLDYHHL